MKGATNLPDVDKFSGKSDPYAIVSFQGKNMYGLNIVLLVRLLQCCVRNTKTSSMTALSVFSSQRQCQRVDVNELKPVHGTSQLADLFN